MSDAILITGHRNPDTDSICSAAAYAYLKNQIKTDSLYYKAIRCGHLNQQTRFIFSKAGLKAPELVRDVRPRVSSVTQRSVPKIKTSSSLFTAVHTLDSHNYTVLPVFDEEEIFRGLVSTHEISAFLIQDNLKSRPTYLFNINNFESVIPGYFYKKEEKQTFMAPIMVGAMPYEKSIQRINELEESRPLFVTGLRQDLIHYAIEKSFPAMVLTGCDNCAELDELTNEYKGTIYISTTDTADTVRRLRLSVPVSTIMNSNPERVDAHAYYTDAKEMMTASSHRGLPVMDGENYIGIVSRRSFIEKPKTKLILVDHNETDQSVAGASEADIVEIIDHHRLGAESTTQPIFIDVRPVGSTSTIIYSHFQQHKIQAPKDIALLMLSGILSDTLILKSPTTTEFDKAAAHELAKIAETSVNSWGEEIFQNTASLKSDNYEKLITSDFKIYTEEGHRIGISQIEVISFSDYNKYKEKISSTLSQIQETQDLEWTMLLITNIIKEESILTTTSHERYERKLIYPALEEHVYKLAGVLSRKKQLLPEILRVVGEQ